MSASRRFGWVLALMLVAGLGGGAGANAELALLTDGSVLKVAAYEVADERVRFELPSGGTLQMSLARVERIVDDEIVPEAERVTDSGLFQTAFSDSDEVPETPYGELIYEVARRHEMNPGLIAAMVRAESAFDPNAVSHKGARGLLQLMPATAERFGVSHHEIHEPARNLDGGVRYLKWLAKRFSGELRLMLAGYNAGEGTVDRYGGVPPYRETNEYIKRIFRFLGLDESEQVALLSSE